MILSDYLKLATKHELLETARLADTSVGYLRKLSSAGGFCSSYKAFLIEDASIRVSQFSIYLQPITNMRDMVKKPTEYDRLKEVINNPVKLAPAS